MYTVSHLTKETLHIHNFSGKNKLSSHCIIQTINFCLSIETFSIVPDNVFWKKDKGCQRDEEQTTPLMLHFLLPLAGILLLWRKRDILSRILVKVDRSLSGKFH